MNSRRGLQACLLLDIYGMGGTGRLENHFVCLVVPEWEGCARVTMYSLWQSSPHVQWNLTALLPWRAFCFIYWRFFGCTKHYFSGPVYTWFDSHAYTNSRRDFLFFSLCNVRLISGFKRKSELQMHSFHPVNYYLLAIKVNTTVVLFESMLQNN